MITSPHNEKLKTIRKLASRAWRERTGLFAAEGEDLIAAADRAGAPAEFILIAGEDVEPGLLDAVSSLGSGTRAIGVYRQRWTDPQGKLSAYLHRVSDPGNVGTIVRVLHALCGAPAVLGHGTADPYSPKAVRASMGSIFACPPARAEFAELRGQRVALHADAPHSIAEVEPEPPVFVCVGGEREGLPASITNAAEWGARIPMRAGGPDSLNAAIAASIALYELGNRMAGHA